MASPAKRMRLQSQSQSQRRQSVTVTTPSQNALRTSTNASNRASATTQSTSYDFLSGQPFEPSRSRRLSQSQIPSQSLRKSTSRQSLLPKPEQTVPVVSQARYSEDTLALQSRINKLEYEVQGLESERGMLTLQHEKELREAQARADADYRKYQEAETERLKAVRQHEAAMKEVRDIRDRSVNDAATIERKARGLQTDNDQLRDEKEDLEARLSDADREIRRIKVEEVEGQRKRLEQQVQEAAAELEEMKTRFDNINIRLQKKERENEELEKKMLDLNSKAGGGEELEVIKREFSEQMDNVRQLEHREREHKTKIQKLEDERRSVNVVMEEKRALEVQVQVLKDAERRASELEMQKEILEDERRTWTSLLEQKGEDDSTPQEFDTPEAVVKALVSERIEHALSTERLGQAETEVLGKDQAINALKSERAVLKLKLEKAEENTELKDALADATKALKQSERDHQLAKKQIEYLQAQLDSHNAENTMMSEPGQQPSEADQKHAEQIQQLEGLVNEYKSEIDRLHSKITDLEARPPEQPHPTPVTGQKRSADDAELEDSQHGAMVRKNKNLTLAVHKLTAQSQKLAIELQATKTQLKSLRAKTSIRVLELRDNPTARHEAIKASTLRTLKQENTELMAQLRGDTEAMACVKVVPVSSLDALRLDLKDMERVLADKDKRMRRQREIWTEKAAEFRDVISSILGHKVTFLPNGKVKVRSMYYKQHDEDGNPIGIEEDVEEDEREDYIELDGEKGTLKIGGGRDGVFGRDIRDTLNYWVFEKKEIPCFLAAMTLEFYERFGGLQPGADT